MIKTFENLFEKMKRDKRYATPVLKDKLKKIQTEKICQKEREEADQSMYWLDGFLFCIMDEKYISHEEWENLHNILSDMMYK